MSGLTLARRTRRQEQVQAVPKKSFGYGSPSRPARYSPALSQCSAFALDCLSRFIFSSVFLYVGEILILCLLPNVNIRVRTRSALSYACIYARARYIPRHHFPLLPLVPCPLSLSLRFIFAVPVTFFCVCPSFFWTPPCFDHTLLSPSRPWGRKSAHLHAVGTADHHEAMGAFVLGVDGEVSRTLAAVCLG